MSLMHGKGNAKTAKSDVSIGHDFTCATGTGAKGSNLKRRKSSVKAVNTAEHTLPKTNASSPSFCSGLLIAYRCLGKRQGLLIHGRKLTHPTPPNCAIVT